MHDLAVEEHSQNTHRHVDKEARKARDGDLPQLARKPLWFHEAQRVLPARKVRQHHEERHRRAQRRGKTRAVNAHIAWEDEEPVAEHIEDAARQHTKRRKYGRAVVAQKCREHLIEEEQREYNFNGDHVPLREGEQRLIRAEKHQKRTLEEDEPDPRERRQNDRADDRCGEILLVLTVGAHAAAALRAEDHTAADAHEKAQAVDDVPHRRDHSQRRRAIRPLILPHHRHIDDAVDAGDQRAAERRRQVFEVKRFDISTQKVHPKCFRGAVVFRFSLGTRSLLPANLKKLKESLNILFFTKTQKAVPPEIRRHCSY